MSLGQVFQAFISPRVGDVALTLSKNSRPEALEKLFNLVFSLFSQQELVNDLKNQYREVSEKEPEFREAYYIRLYFDFEQMLVSSQQPLVVSQYTISDIRQRVAKSIPLTELSPMLALVFYPAPLQTLTLFDIGLPKICLYVQENLGKSQLDSVFREMTDKTILSGMNFRDGAIVHDQGEARLATTSQADLIQVYRALYNKFYLLAGQILGKKYVDEVYRQIYHLIASLYPYTLVKQILEVLPTELFRQERLALLNREDLELTVATRTAELVEAKLALERKVKEFEDQNKELDDTKRATLNLLEDARELEKKLKNERDRAQAIISSMGEGLLVIDKDSRLTLINPVAERLLEVQAGDFVGKPWSDLAKTFKGTENVPNEERTFLRCLQTGKVIVTGLDLNHFYQTIGGRIFPVVSVTAPLTAEGVVVGAVKIFRDATAEKEQKILIEKTVAERTRELRAEKARLTSSINALPLGFFIVGVDHTILVLNEQMKVILGGEISVSKLEELVKLFDNQELSLAHMCNHCRGNNDPYENKNIEYRGRFLRIFSVPVLVDDELLGTAVLMEDITEAKNLERSRDEFFSIASHELRTPLAAIRGNASLIQERFAGAITDNEFKEMVEDIYTSSVRLIEIVNDFLNTSRLELQKIAFKKEEFDLPQLVTEVIGELTSQVEEKKLSLVLEPTPQTLPQALADRNRVREALINLIGNALKFTDKGGVKVSVGEQEGMIEVAVTDTGRGISQKNRSLLFHKFQQAGDSLYTRDTTKGTGLGLYISKLMIESMGGHIYLKESTEGTGSTFAFTLPIVVKK